jgi:hypothetical protein
MSSTASVTSRVVPWMVRLPNNSRPFGPFFALFETKVRFG